MERRLFMATSTVSKSALLSGAAEGRRLGRGRRLSRSPLMICSPTIPAGRPSSISIRNSSSATRPRTRPTRRSVPDQPRHHRQPQRHLHHLAVTATDFSYFEQIGNKGTWSEAHVDAHGTALRCRTSGPACSAEDFDGRGAYELVSQSVRLDVTDSGDTDTNGWTGTTSVQFTMALESPALPETTG